LLAMSSGSVDDPLRRLAVGTRGNLVEQGLNGEGAPCPAQLNVSPRLLTGPERVSFDCFAHSGEALEMGSRSFVGTPEGRGNGRRAPLVHSIDLAA
jgi:hypothetical protein